MYYSFIGMSTVFVIHLPINQMSRGKYKRKRKHAQQRAENEQKRASLLKSTVATGQANAPTHAHNKNGEHENEAIMTFGEIRAAILKFIKEPSLTDWLLVAFTLVLAVASIWQWGVTKGQLSVMQKDERPWIRVDDTGTQGAPEPPSWWFRPGKRSPRP